MFTRCMGEEEAIKAIYSPLSEWDVHQINNQKCVGREFKMRIELRIYEMDGVMLDLRSDVNILRNKSWELMGKSNFVWSLIQLRLANQYKIYPIGRLEQVEVNIEGGIIGHLLYCLQYWLHVLYNNMGARGGLGSP